MKRAFTLLEVLVSIVLLGIVASMAMYVFRSQHQNLQSEADHSEVGMMAMGTLDEISRAIRMTGGGMPLGVGGIRTWSTTTPAVTFVVNRSRWTDTASGYSYVPGSRRLRLAIDSASKFSDAGYAYLSLTTPSIPGSTGVPSISVNYRLPIVDRVAGGNACTTDSLVLDAGMLVDPPNNWTNVANIQVAPNSLVYNIDSVSFLKSNDTLYTWANRSPRTVYALGVDTFLVQYHHPNAGWANGLSSILPSNAVDMVRVRVVIRNRRHSQWLEDKNPGSRGYRFFRLETEVSLRNDSLVNQ
ncbi:MAG: type II secretion system protein [Fibrobacterota bacterium]|nr:type II secretion system protein [Fibrobacterota bacterium]QQS05684.1 MAG: type II secretion system protein [Fibrobacterota bacterium]